MMMLRPSTLACALAVLFGTGALGCAGQSENFDDRDWTKDHGIQSPGDQSSWREVETLFGADESSVDRYDSSLRGVRHDLTMGGNAKPDTRCTCLDVAIGDPRDKRFTWAGRRPVISGKNMVIALRTAGSKCGSPLQNRRPSIQAVDVKRGNVTIVVEELTFDRPQALGAIIRKPSADGDLFVRARGYKNKKLPYARQRNGKSLCLIETDSRSHHRQIRSGRRF